MNRFFKNSNLEENQDGTVKGGYVSLTEGRYRVIIGSGIKSTLARPQNSTAAECNKKNIDCDNVICPDSENWNCHNDSCYSR